MKEILSDIRAVLGILGYDQYSGYHDARPVLFLLIQIFLIVNSWLIVVFNWDDLNKRVDGIKVLLVYFWSLLYILTYALNWEKSVLLIKTLEEGFYKYPYRPRTGQLNLERSINQGMLKINTIWYYACVSFGAIQTLPTVVVLIIQMIKTNVHGLSVDLLILPGAFYFPTGYETLPVYFIAYLLQAVFSLNFMMHSYVILVSGFVSMQLIESELRLLRLSIEEMDSLIEIEGSAVSTCTTDMNYQALRAFGTHLVNHHRDIYRKANNVISGIPTVAMATNSFSSLQLCITIYMLVQNDNLTSKVAEGWYCCLTVITLYCCNIMGERISIEDEKLRKAMYECSWEDKPNWFKKSLLIMMTRANRPIEIASAGLFAVNLKTFSAVNTLRYFALRVLQLENHFSDRKI